MDHADHVHLIRDGVIDRPGAWADLGSGHGAFTLALADLLGPNGTIVSVDRDATALAAQRSEMTRRFPETRVDHRVADFGMPIDLPPLDGMVMANSLHFIRDADKPAVLDGLLSHLRPGGRFVLVEYDADAGNHWVPYPLSFATWRGRAQSIGLSAPRSIGRVPSRFLGAIYAAVADKAAQSG
jgi:ubiquinone/menaquinone biosynthesis C-methylase UbiE